MNNLYLEISPRQSGKTTRLLLAVQQHIAEGGIAIVVTTGHNMSKLMYDTLMPTFRNLPSRLYFFGGNKQAELGQRMNFVNDERVRYFYDEFDFIDPEMQFLSTLDYYVTTPRKLRNPKDMESPDLWKKDALLSLIQMNDGVYEFVEPVSFYHKSELPSTPWTTMNQVIEGGTLFETELTLAVKGQEELRKMARQLNDKAKNDEYDSSLDYYDA